MATLFSRNVMTAGTAQAFQNGKPPHEAGLNAVLNELIVGMG
ncbi:hypothetical protein [Echinicola sp. 20G]|nr:hypothetical protein [Echinicola sp. 20G]